MAEVVCVVALLRPFRAVFGGGLVSQGGALGYDIAPLQGLVMLCFMSSVTDYG